ncbi:HD-GYP domain-containing protein [Oceanobacillus sp. CAU 1775]
MQVQTSQLREGYVLLKDILGKSGRPIMKANTVLTEEHIMILQNFLIPVADVRTKLDYDYGVKRRENSQQVNVVEEKVKTNDKEIAPPKEPEKSSFKNHYLEVVSSFKKEYMQWNSGVPVNIANVREMIIPLLSRVEELDIEPYTLYDYSDPGEYIYHHAVSVSVIAAFIAKELGFSKGEALQVGLAGILCDAGMTRVDEEIIKKGGPLTEKQQQDIRNHPIYSFRMVENLPAISPSVKTAVLQHHERMDGSGYPGGKSGDEIHIFARILAISDTYDAMASERLYKNRQPVYKVLSEIEKEQYIAFDSKIVQVFIKSLSIRSLGKRVELSDGKTGEIVFINETDPTRPLIKLDDTQEIISLVEKQALEIIKFI